MDVPVEPVQIGQKLVAIAFASAQADRLAVLVQRHEVDFNLGRSSVCLVPVPFDPVRQAEITEALAAPLLVQGCGKTFEPGAGLP